MEKKKLYIITELFPPDETSTSYILGEMANAAAKEYEVHVICGPEIYDARKKLDVEHPFHIDPAIKIIRAEGLGIDKNTTTGKARSFLAMSHRLYKLAKQNIKEGDKVLLVTNPAPLVLLMCRLRNKRNFELNILVHDVFPENTKPAGLHIPSLAYKLAKWLFDKAYSRADKLLALGRDMADVLRKKVVRQAHQPIVQIVENWGDVENIHPLPFPEGAIKLEYAGNIGRVQGLDKLVDELPKDIEMHFYGTGAMEKTLKEEGQPNVFFHGPYFRSQQEEVLGAAHVSVVTLNEGMYGLGVPSKAYNIMAAGRPIIYFGPENGEIGLLIKEKGIGYIGWPKEWNLEELKAMGAKARDVAEAEYSKETILKKFIKALQ
jgi:glycosyltransferase involved in cell wall biosynthesis